MEVLAALIRWVPNVKKELSVWVGTCLSVLVGVLVGGLTWYLPRSTRGEDLDFVVEVGDLVMLLVVGAVFGMLFGALLTKFKVRFHQWLVGAVAAVTWAVIVPYVFFRDGASGEDTFRSVNQQRELIGYGSSFLLLSFPLLLVKLRR